MRILVYTHEFAPWSGGIATYNLELAQGLAARGHDVLVLAPKYSGNGKAAQSGQYRVWRPFPDKGFKPYKILASMVSLVIVWLWFRPDVIFATNGGRNGALLLRRCCCQSVHQGIGSVPTAGGWRKDLMRSRGLTELLEL